MESVSAYASKTNKGVNQDYCVSVTNTDAKFTGLIVTDGIGSHYKAEIGAQICAHKLKKILELVTDLSQLDFDKFFIEVRDELVNYVKETDDYENLVLDKSYGTTLLCALDIGDKYVIAYTGNGSAWYIDGRFNQFSENYYLPWNSINVLNPHCIEHEGKPALFKCISLANFSCIPTVITISKNKSEPGEIIVLATDGIFTNDEAAVGKDDEQTVWTKSDGIMSMFYNYLSSFLSKDIKENEQSEKLKSELETFLLEVEQSNLMHDDTTLGVMISPNAIAYHQKLRDSKQAANSNEINTGN